MTMISWLRRSRRSALLTLLLVVPRVSHAQLAEGARIAVGTQVRVRTRDGREDAWRFERASSDNLTLRRHAADSDELLSIPWSEAERIDTMVISPPSAHRILVGGAVGGLVGLAVVYVGATRGTCHAELSCPGVAFAILGPEIISAGTLIGGIAGYVHRDQHWSTAWRASKAPTPAGH